MQEWTVYRKFLLAVLTFYVTDILWGILEYLKLPILLFADTTAYFLAISVCILFWAQFAVSYLEGDTPFGRFLIHSGRALASLIALVTLVNLFVPVLFTVDADAVYQALPWRTRLLGCQIVLLLTISGFAFSRVLKHHTEKRRRYRALMLFGLIMALLLVMQLHYPEFPFYTIANMLGTRLLRAFVVNDEKEEYRRSREEIARIKAATQSISALLDNMPALSFSKDAESGIYLACNQAFAVYAYKEKPEDVVGLTDAQIFDAETAAHFVKTTAAPCQWTSPIFSLRMCWTLWESGGSSRQRSSSSSTRPDASACWACARM